ncbi:hypothetical protein B566_EDAN017548 [Ephemera danica]|nr:hypothetical protein B566_EDAN017548 [Ephemera danica]
MCMLNKIPFLIGYGSLPRANHSAPLSDTRLDGTGLLSGVDLSSPYCQDSALPLLETVAEDQEMASKPRADEAAQDTDMHASTTLPEHANSGTTPAILVSDENNDVIKTENDTQTEAKMENNVKTIVGNMENKRKEDSFDSGGVPGYGEYYFRDSFDHSSSESQLDMGGRVSGMTTTREGLALQPHLGGPPTPLPTRSFNLLRVFVPAFLFAALILTAVLIVVLESDSELLSGLRGLPEMVILRQEYYEPAKEYIRQKLGNML